MSCKLRSSRAPFSSSSTTPLGALMSNPQKQVRLLQPDARHLVEPVADQSEHSPRLVLIGHGDVRVAIAAARRREVDVRLRHAYAVNACNARPTLHAQQLHIVRVELANQHSRVTQRRSFCLQAVRFAPLASASASTQCHQPIGARVVWPAFSRADEHCVRVAHMAHTVNVARVVCVCVRARTRRARHSIAQIREEQLVCLRVAAHPDSLGNRVECEELSHELQVWLASAAAPVLHSKQDNTCVRVQYSTYQCRSQGGEGGEASPPPETPENLQRMESNPGLSQQ